MTKYTKSPNEQLRQFKKQTFLISKKKMYSARAYYCIPKDPE